MNMAISGTSKILQGEEFDVQVLNDDRVWLVEFYSNMCGSCQEFAPKWEKLEGSLKSIATGKINIDDKAGMNIAKKLGVLEQGLPNIQLFKGNGKSVTILAGDDASPKQLLSKIKTHVKDLTRRDDGFYLKNSHSS
eukprot:gene1444-2780_t